MALRQLTERDLPRLCVWGFGPCGCNGSFIEPFWIKNSELVSGGNPFSDMAARFFEVAYGQINQLGGGIIGWEAAPGFGGFSDYPVQAFNRVGGIDDLAHRWREGEERDDLLPGPPPAWGDGGIFLAPFGLKIIKGFCRFLVIHRLINAPQAFGDSLAVFPTAETQGMTHQMHDAG